MVLSALTVLVSTGALAKHPILARGSMAHKKGTTSGVWVRFSITAGHLKHACPKLRRGAGGLPLLESGHVYHRCTLTLQG